MSSELMPCPFCGSGLSRPSGRYTNASFSGVEMINLGAAYRVWCGTCGGEGPTEISEKDAVASWNRRTQPIPTDDAVEAVAWEVHLTRFGDDGSHPCDDDYRIARAAIAAMQLTTTK